MLQKNVLIPWKLTTYEIFNSFSDLLKPDIEETVFESKPGAYYKVPEFDFDLTYPNTKLKKNILSDTINYDCCGLKSNNNVSELEHMYHF